MSAPSIGAMRRRFAVEEPVAGADGGLAWQARFSAWGAIGLKGDAVAIALRARGAVAPGWRLRLGARAFEIVARQRDDSASGVMLCLCREIAP